MLCNNVSLTAQKFEYNVLSPECSGAVSFLNLLKASSLLGEYLIFSSDFKNIEHLITLVSSNAASREPLVVFIAFIVSPSAN